MITSYINNLLGECPSGYEPLRYAIAGIVLIFLITLVYRMIQNMFGVR